MKIRFFLILSYALLVVAVPSITYSDEKTEILGVVEAFCNLDFHGARLSSHTWDKISAYVAWEEEPGWDIALAIKRYHIGKVVVSGQRAVVTVRYDIEKSCPHSFEPTQLQQFETAELELVKKNGSWVINSKLIYPRVSSEILCHKYNCCE
jgi:hypothetical protein